MESFQRGLTALATRARGGEPTAARQFRQAIEPHLTRIVGHVLRGGQGPGQLAQQIFAAVADVQAFGDPDAHDDVDALARQVAGRLCDSAVGRLQPGYVSDCAARETVRF